MLKYVKYDSNSSEVVQQVHVLNAMITGVLQAARCCPPR